MCKQVGYVFHTSYKNAQDERKKWLIYEVWSNYRIKKRRLSYISSSKQTKQNLTVLNEQYKTRKSLHLLFRLSPRLLFVHASCASPKSLLLFDPNTCTGVGRDIKKRKFLDQIKKSTALLSQADRMLMIQRNSFEITFKMLVIPKQWRKYFC